MLLNCHTYYSFRYGTFSIDELFEQIIQNGYTTFALTDINNTSACLDTIRRAKEKGLKPSVGIDFRNGITQQYVGIACNNEGFRELNEHLSRHLHQEKNFTVPAPEFHHAHIIYPLSVYRGWPLKENEWVGVSVKDLQHIPFLRHKLLSEKTVALQPFTFGGRSHFNTHRLLRAIAKNTLLSKLTAAEQSTEAETVMTLAQMHAAYAAYPHMIANAERILSQCYVDFDYGKLANKNLKHYTFDMAGDMQLLRTECEKGLLYRYGNPSDEVLKRMNRELEVIEQMNFASYYLINWDIITYARHKNYYYVGRGSGANSIIAYLLHITDVDPVELDLYFERFINIYRSNAPDFDIDFSWTDRDDVTRYIFERFGHERTALLGAYNTFQRDAMVRELGKVFGLPPGEIDKLQNAERYPNMDNLGKLVLQYSELIRGFPSHMSIHSSGILISEKPVSYYSATFMPPKGYPTTQFSMLEAEDVGLFKFDILSQRGLGKIKDSLDIIKKNKGVDIDIHNLAVFKKDESVKELLRSGKAIGCFYVESPAMRMLLAKLGADDYLRLVAASSIIRPGVAKSGMMREYIVRFRDEKLRKKARQQLPELYDLLDETYGVMVYQEDVIKVAHFFAGLSLAEADYLRRGMSWKFKKRNEFGKVKENFFSNCIKKGYQIKVIGEIWTQIESFANYAFSKGHSASYAVESFQALYLKAHFPLEYMVATLNNGGGFYRPELYVHEARMHGAEIHAPCINNSDALCSIHGNIIFLGLGMISGIEHETLRAIIAERNRSGFFFDMENMVSRVPAASLDQVRLLIRAGAFDFTGRNRKELLWEIHSILQPHVKRNTSEVLFEMESKQWKLPDLSVSDSDEAFEQVELFGFPLCSPFHLLREPVPVKLTARQLPAFLNRTVTIAGYLISIKYTQTSKQERMYFGTFIDLEGAWIDTVHFPQSAKNFPFTGAGCYVIQGKVVEEYGFRSMEVNYMKRLPVKDRE